MPTQPRVVAATLALALALLAWVAWRWTGDFDERGEPAFADGRTSERASASAARAYRVEHRGRRPAQHDEPTPSMRAGAAAGSKLVTLVDSTRGECLLGAVARCQALEPNFEACGQGDARACLRAAEEVAETPPRDLRVSRVLLQRACTAGAAEACERLERDQRLREQLDDDPELEQLAWQQCDLGDAQQCHALLDKHRGDERPDERKRVLRRLCELGFDRDGCMSLALQGDPEQSRWALAHACTLDSPDGCQLYAQHLLGHGPGADEAELDLEGADRAYAEACELAPEHSACDEWARVAEAGGWPDDLD